ncbi:hypothetical protein S40293_09984 [Stachybotrys chartarum IBT 40293]|nr:hypothetical protein S40293_09984 [Stachybotrys chartarum IBT 40293]
MAETFGLAVNIVTVVDLLVKIGIQCSEYCANIKSAPHDVRDILNEADRFSATLRDVESLLKGPNGANFDASRNLRGTIEDSHRQLNILATKLEQGTRNARLVWPLKKQEVTNILATLKCHRDIIALDLQVHQTTVLRTLHQEVILQKLRIVEQAGFDAHTEADSPTCLAGTRTNILRQISEWHAARDSKTIFWLNGMAGTGKSTISRTVAKVFADTGVLGASFFFKRGEGDRGRATFFFSTIVAQLIRQIPSLAPYVRDKIEADPSISTKSISKQFDDLIASPIRQLPLDANRQPMVAVVDALDECDNLENAKLLLQLLAQTKQFETLRLKFLVTSRPELPIELGFEDICGQYDSLILQEIPQPDIRHDITLFMQHELSKIRQEWNSHVRPDRQLSPSWPDADAQKLVDMAIPLFVFASTVCRYLRDRRLGGPQDQLTKVLQHRGGHKSSLDKTYLPVLDQFSIGLEELEKKDVAERFKKIVGSIIVLASPLSSSALARLIGVPLHNIEAQLDLLHSVLSIPSDSDAPIRLLHLSFRDFLIDSEKRSMTIFWIDATQKNEEGLTLLDDAIRFNLTYLSTIDSYPLQIYALVAVIPLKSPIRKMFLTTQWAWLSVSGTLEQSWDSCLQTLEGHSGRVDSVVFSPDANHLASASWDQTVRLWDVTTGQCLQTLKGHSNGVNSVVFSPDAKHLASASWDQTVRLWDAATGQYLQTLKGHSSWVNSVVFSPDANHLASASWDQTVRLWDATTGQCLQTLKGHSDGIISVVFSPDAKYLASASWDQTVRLWDATTGQCLQILEGHSGRVDSVVFSPDAKHLASASDDQTVRLWDATTGQYLQTLKGHSNRVNLVVFSPDAKHLASASWDQTIRLWDITTGQCLQTLEGHSGGVNSVVFSPDAKHLVSASDDQTVRLWDATASQYLQILEGHSGRVNSVVFSPDAKHLASASWDQTVRLWDATTGQCLQTLEGHSGGVNSVVFSPDAKHLASASWDQTVRLWDITTSQCLQILEGHSGRVISVVFSPDAKHLASASDDQTVRLWDITTSQCLQILEGHSGRVNSVVFSPDAKHLASASDDQTVRLWDATTGQCLQTLEGHSDRVNSVVFSLDANHLASASWDQTVRLWDATTGKHYSPVSPTIEPTIGCY